LSDAVRTETEVGAGKLAARSDVRPRLLYATPTGRHPRLGYLTSIMAIRLGQKAFAHDAEDFVMTSGPVQMARCEIARQALTGGYDYVLMHDDDLIVHHRGGAAGNPLDTFLGHMKADPKVGVVGAVYLREAPMIPTVNMWHPDGAGSEHVPGEMVNAVCGLPQTPFECGGIGTGFMLVRTQVFRDIARKTGGIDPFLFWPYRTKYGTNEVMGEDFYFCWRAQQAGWKVLADPTLATVHEKDSGRLEFQHGPWEAAEKHNVGAPDGSQIILVDGIQCIDVSECRKREGAAMRKAA
jgi:hypothetical protein